MKNNPEHYRQYQKEYYQRNKERLKNKRIMMRDEILEHAKEYRKTHSQQISNGNKRRYLLNQQKNKEYRKEYKKSHREQLSQYERNRRARKRNKLGNIDYESWIMLCNKYGNRCLCCGKMNIKLTLDHVIPLSCGGTHTIDNIQPLCKSCNSKKFTKIIDYRTQYG